MRAGTAGRQASDANGPPPSADARRRCLSAHQRALLNLDASRPGGISARFTMNLVLRLRGSLDLDAMAAAFDDLVAAHDVLRTRLVQDSDSDKAHAEVWPHTGATLDVLDSELPDAALFAEWDATEIDPWHPPLMRCVVARRDDDEHLVALLFSHTVADETALEVAAEVLGRAYEARLRGGRLAAPVWQYGDYAAWQSERLTQRIEANMAAWERLLGGIRGPTYRRDAAFVPGQPTAPAETRLSMFSSREVEAITEWSWRNRSTLFTTLLAAFGRAIRADADQDDLLVLTVLERRDHPAARQMIGPFFYVTPVRLEIAPDEPWEATVRRVTTATLETRALEPTPLLSLLPLAPELIPGVIGLKPTWMRIFQYVPVAYETYRFGEASGTVVHRGDGIDDAPAFGLRLTAWPASDGALLVEVAYDANELNQESVRRVIWDVRRHARSCMTS